MNEKKELACQCGNTLVRLSLTDTSALEVECPECGSIRKVGRGLCPTRLAE